MDIPRPDLSPRAGTPVPPAIAPVTPPAPSSARAGFHPPEGLILAVPAGLALGLAVAVLILGQGTGALVAGGLYLAAAAVVVVAMGRHYPHARLGACNVVTLMRLALTAALVAPLAGGLAPGVAPGFAAGWTVAAIATVALALDGVDGFLARRSNLCSDVGGRFDMEVDAALALILALHAYLGSPVGAEVLTLGVMRYLFVGAGAVWPWILAPLPVSYLRKGVCVLQLATLIVLQLPGLPADTAIVLARIAAAALIWSFARDVLWLRRHR